MGNWSMYSDLSMLRRERRHLNYIGSFEQEKCFQPEEFIESSKEACSYVRNHYRCHDVVHFINYLEILVCTLEGSKTFLGHLKAILFTLALFIILSAFLFIMGMYFIMPNVIIVMRRLQLPKFEFGLVVSIAVGMPNVLSTLWSCHFLHERGSVLLAGAIGKIIVCLAVGTMIICFKAPGFKPGSVRFLSFMVIQIGVCIYLVELLSANMRNILKAPETQNAKTLEVHAIVFVVIFVVVMLLDFVQLPQRRSRLRASALSEEIAMQTPSALDDEGTEMSLAMKYRPSISLVPAVTLSEQNSATSIITQEQEERRSSYYSITNIQISDDESELSFTSDAYPGLPNPIRQDIDPWVIFFSCITPTQQSWHICWQLLSLPMWIICGFFIPVVDKKRLLNGWCKFIACTSLVLFPLSLRAVYPVTNFQFVGMVVIGLTLSVLALLLTHCQRIPTSHDIFAAYGCVVGFFFYCWVDTELGTLLWQFVQYFHDWDADVIMLLAFPLGSWITLATFCITIIKHKFANVAFGFVTGLALFNACSILPVIVCNLCKETVLVFPVSAHTETGYIFLLLLYACIIIAMSSSNFEFRRSLGAFIAIYLVYYHLFMALAAFQEIHPFGVHHYAQKLNGTSAKWA